MLQGAVSGVMLGLSCCLLLWVCAPADGGGPVSPVGPFPTFTPVEESVEADFEDWELGSGSSPFHLFHSFPADSPFTKETSGKPINCTQRFWLPPYSTACWENLAEPEEFAKCRLLVLQNRAALQAVSASSGVEDGGMSYDLQAREEVEGIRSDHLNVTETVQFMERVFAALEEKRKEGEEQGILTRWNFFLLLFYTEKTVTLWFHLIYSCATYSKLVSAFFLRGF